MDTAYLDNLDRLLIRLSRRRCTFPDEVSAAPEVQYVDVQAHAVKVDVMRTQAANP